MIMIIDKNFAKQIQSMCFVDKTICWKNHRAIERIIYYIITVFTYRIDYVYELSYFRYSIDFIIL